MDDTVIAESTRLVESTVKKAAPSETLLTNPENSSFSNPNLVPLVSRQICFEELIPIQVETVDNVEQKISSFDSELIFDSLSNANSRRAAVERKLAELETGEKLLNNSVDCTAMNFQKCMCRCHTTLICMVCSIKTRQNEVEAGVPWSASNQSQCS